MLCYQIVIADVLLCEQLVMLKLARVQPVLTPVNTVL